MSPPEVGHLIIPLPAAVEAAARDADPALSAYVSRLPLGWGVLILGPILAVIALPAGGLSAVGIGLLTSAVIFGLLLVGHARHRRAVFLHRHACANTKRHSNRKGNHPGHCPCDLYQSAASPWTYLQSQYGHSTQPCFLAICSQTRGWPNAPSPPSQAIRHWSVILVSGAEGVMHLPLGWGHARCL